MANIKDLKAKVKSTKGTLKITTAMKLVSAAKLNKAQMAITHARPYSAELEQMVKVSSALVDNYSHKYLEESENKKELLFVVSSNKGLCGGYNSQLAKCVKNYISDSDKDIKVYFLGKKVREAIYKEVNEGTLYQFATSEPTYDEVKHIADELSELFVSGEFGSVKIAYNEFKSAISFNSQVKQLLPMTLDSSDTEKLKKDYPFDFKYEPGAKDILDSIIPESYISTIFTAVLDATASEHGSRMASMDSATKNCKEAIRSQTLKMNKLRQAAITTELIEVVSGAESLNG